MKRPPDKPYGPVTKAVHEQWWSAYLAASAAKVIEAECRQEQGTMDLTDNLNAIGRWRVRSRNVGFARKWQIAYRDYENIVKDAALFCPDALRKHVAGNAFPALFRMLRERTPHIFQKLGGEDD